MGNDEERDSDLATGGLAPKPLPVALFDGYITVMVGGMKKVTEVADRGIANALFGVGGIMIFGGFVFRLVPQVTLEAVEFIGLLAVGALLILVATGLRYYAYKLQIEFAHAQSRVLAAAQQAQAEQMSALAAKAIEASDPKAPYQPEIREPN